MVKKNIPQSDIKVLWGKSGGRCALCKTPTVETDSDNCNYPIGEMAHIEGENDGSARYNYNMSTIQRNSSKNLLLLCPTCHTRIDKNPVDFTVERLTAIKYDHEKWVVEALQSSIINIDFSELDVICKYLKSTPITTLENITVIPPEEKIKKNHLSVGVGNLITMGMLQSKLVKDYLNRNPDIEFSERLRAGFVIKYQKLVSAGFEGDGLFYELFRFAANNSLEPGMRAAGLAVLTYFFQICEVFEK